MRMSSARRPFFSKMPFCCAMKTGKETVGNSGTPTRIVSWANAAYERACAKRTTMRKPAGLKLFIVPLLSIERTINLFGGDRQVEQAGADGVRDGVGDRRRRTIVRKLADSLRIVRSEAAVGRHEDRLQPRDIGGGRQLVVAEASVGDAPAIEHQQIGR